MATFAIDTSYSSPSHSERGDHAVSLLVLHATVGSLQGSLSWLTNPLSRVSIHYLISKAGRVYRLVPEHLAAWHAGKAAWRGETAVNEISIGIELENLTGAVDPKTGKLIVQGQDPYPGEQIAALTDLTHDLLSRYSLTPDSLARHADVAVPKGRKTDPRGFPWNEWQASLAGQPIDEFAAWGPIGKPEGTAQSFAIPRAWLMNKSLGACVRAEEYLTPELSVAVFQRGFCWYNAVRKAAFVELF